jgi:hypothetical protein
MEAINSMEILSTKEVFMQLSRPVQSFETQYFNNNQFNFRSLFGHKFGLRNHLKNIKVFGLIFDLIDIWGQLIDLLFDSYIQSASIWFDIWFVLNSAFKQLEKRFTLVLPATDSNMFMDLLKA